MVTRHKNDTFTVKSLGMTLDARTFQALVRELKGNVSTEPHSVVEAKRIAAKAAKDEEQRVRGVLYRANAVINKFEAASKKRTRAENAAVPVEETREYYNAVMTVSDLEYIPDFDQVQRENWAYEFEQEGRARG